MTLEQRTKLERLAHWHAGQACSYRKAAPITAMDHPELTTASFEATAHWHDEQAAMLRDVAQLPLDTDYQPFTELTPHVHRL